MTDEDYLWHHIVKSVGGGKTVQELKSTMTHDEFLSWKEFIQKEIEDERDVRGLTLWYLAHLSYYIYDLKYILGGNNPYKPKDFWIELDKKDKGYNKPEIMEFVEGGMTEEEVENAKMEMEKTYIGMMLGLNYPEIKRKHGK